MHEMDSDRSSRANNVTNFREMSMRAFFNSNTSNKKQNGRHKHKHVAFRERNLREATRATPRM